MFDKIANILGKVKDFGSNLIKPMKHTISNGWDMLKSGVSKAGKFIYDNHENIGTILSGVGSIIGNLPNSQLKQRLSNYADNADKANNFLHGGFNRMNRPKNTPRTQISNNLSSKYEQNNKPPDIATPSQVSKTII
jgi:hypothetical protein